ncbi:MAG TPA: GNAT family protein [Chloroflexota bacterium]|nr:GNAT family protein [Chloroflexota bacterium]
MSDSTVSRTAEEGGQWGWKPAPSPARLTLTGSLVTLRPIDLNTDSRPLFESSHDGRDPHLWEYLFHGPFPSEAEFRRYLTGLAASTDDIFFTVVERSTSRPSGICSYLRMVPAHGVIEIGHIWFVPALQRTPQATEAIYLLARHVFDDLGYRRLEWKCDARNVRSRRAAERFGFHFEGIFRQHMVVKGRNRDTAWFGMTDGDWAAVKQAFEEWLRPENFDSSGRQRRSLEAIRAALI